MQWREQVEEAKKKDYRQVKKGASVCKTRMPRRLPRNYSIGLSHSAARFLLCLVQKKTHTTRGSPTFAPFASLFLCLCFDHWAEAGCRPTLSTTRQTCRRLHGLVV